MNLGENTFLYYLYINQENYVFIAKMHVKMLRNFLTVHTIFRFLVSKDVRYDKEKVTKPRGEIFAS